MPRPIVVTVVANAAKANRDLKTVAGLAGAVGDGFRKAAVPAGAGLAVIAAGAKQAVDAASDVAENVAKNGEVFGSYAKDIERFSARAGKALGQSKNEALDAAATFGIIGQKAGLSTKESAEFSKQFVTLASDMASFNNTTPEEAITAIGAAMRGESEPIRRYGVLLDDATLRNRALKLGLISSVKQALTPQQKALAASKEILAQTSKAQGDFARTSDGAANKARILAARSENLKAKFGAVLLPVYVRGQAILGRVLTVLEQHQSTTLKVVAAVAALATFVLAVNAAMTVAAAVTATYRAALIAWQIVVRIGIVLQYAAGAAWLAWRLIVVGTTAALKVDRAAMLALNVAMRANPVGIVITALALLVAGLVVAWKRSETFRRIVTGAWNGVKAAAQAVGSFVAAHWRKIAAVVLVAAGPIGIAAVLIVKNWNRIRAAAAGLLSAVRTAFGNVVAFVRGVPGKIVAAFAGAGSLLTGVGRQIVEGLIGGIRDMAGRAASAAKDVVGGAISGAKKVLGIASPSRVFRQIGRWVGKGFEQGIIRSTPGILKVIRRQGVDTAKEYAKQATDLARQFRKAAADRLRALQKQANDYAAAVRNNARAGAALSNYRPPEEQSITAAGLAQYLRDQLNTINNFRRKIALLAKKGLSKDLLNQIVQMGPEQGTAYAEALATASPAAIREMNRLQGRIASSSTSLGRETSRRMYGAGVAAARGFLRGMQSLVRQIASNAARLGREMVRAIKRALGIKSPSRVFRTIGVQTMQGLARGLAAQRNDVVRQVQSVASAVASVPVGMDLAAADARGLAAARPGGLYIKNVNVTFEPGMSVAEMGRGYKRAIQAAERLGIA